MIDFEFCGREVVPMSVSYNKLWKLLIDKKMTASDLLKAANVAPNTMTKLRRDEDVSLDVLRRICAVLNVNIGDIMDFIFDDQKEC